MWERTNGTSAVHWRFSLNHQRMRYMRTMPTPTATPPKLIIVYGISVAPDRGDVRGRQGEEDDGAGGRPQVEAGVAAGSNAVEADRGEERGQRAEDGKDHG
jgi:hypothetical protein